MGKNFNLDEYVTVHERVEKFYSKHPQGRITTSIVEHDAEKGFILMRAEVFREQEDVMPAAIGHAYELRSSGYVQQGSYVEVCETSAVGRALALLGFEVRRGIASREEMEKAARMNEKGPKAPEARAESAKPSANGPESAKPGGGKPDGGKPAPRPAAQTDDAAAPPAPPRAAEAPPTSLDEEILRSADALGYDAAKVRRWVNQKFGVTGGLESLTNHDKREVLKIFREQARPEPAKPARR
jgi:hypothetical protein